VVRRITSARAIAAATRTGSKSRSLANFNETPLPSNARCDAHSIELVIGCVTAGTVSDKGRDARDVMFGLAKTCMKLKVSFYQFVGNRLGIPGPKIPDLVTLVSLVPP
jgi:hypothetical protein